MISRITILLALPALLLACPAGPSGPGSSRTDTGVTDTGVTDTGVTDTGVTDSGFVPSALLLASTDFSDMVLGDPYVASAATWYQDFEPPFRVNGSRAVFQLLVASSFDVNTCLQNTIVDGYLRRQKLRSSCGPWMQDALYFDPIAGIDTLYIRYRISFDNLPSANGWRTITAFKGECKRLEFYVYSDGSGVPYWYAQFDNEANCGLAYNRWWSGENRAAPIETGRWYTVEIRWAPGEVWWAIDGVTIMEGSGFPVASPERLMPIIVYGSYSIRDRVDDLLIYADWPCGPRTSCVGR